MTNRWIGLPQHSLDNFLMGALWELIHGGGHPDYWEKVINDLKEAGAKVKSEA